MGRINVSSGASWEGQAGYSRAVRVGDRVVVSGTTATDAAGNLVGIGDAHGQAVQALSNITRALTAAGARIEDVIRTRMYVSDIQHWQDVARAHAEFFAEVRPASTLVAVAGLINEDMLVEIEAEAVIGASDVVETVLTQGNAS